MKTKNKGKVFPSPLPPFASSVDGCLSVLKFLPAVVLVLVSALSPEDKEVLAYLITRSLNNTVVSAGRILCFSKKSSKKKRSHKPPLFDCECFDCYTSYWFRWDSSPNHELIHQIIEVYEDHLTNSEKSKRNNVRGKKKEKHGRRVVEPSGRPKQPMAKISKPLQPKVTPEKSPENLMKTESLLVETTGHKGFAKVLSLFSSRFWKLWNLNA